MFFCVLCAVLRGVYGGAQVDKIMFFVCTVQCYEACMEARKSAERQEKEASDQMNRAETTMTRSRLKAIKILNGTEDGQHLKASMLGTLGNSSPHCFTACARACNSL